MLCFPFSFLSTLRIHFLFLPFSFVWIEFLSLSLSSTTKIRRRRTSRMSRRRNPVFPSFSFIVLNLPRKLRWRIWQRRYFLLESFPSWYRLPRASSCPTRAISRLCLSIVVQLYSFWIQRWCRRSCWVIPRRRCSITTWQSSLVSRLYSQFMGLEKDYLRERTKTHLIEVLTTETLKEESDIDIESNISKKAKKIIITFIKKDSVPIDILVNDIRVCATVVRGTGSLASWWWCLLLLLHGCYGDDGISPLLLAME